jgi:hypothetical protein
LSGQASSRARAAGATRGRRAVASFTSYEEAQRAVDLLSDRKFPVERVAIVGRGVQLVEQVTGRMDLWRAALTGAVQGAFIGALFGWLFGLFDWIDPLISALTLALYGLLWGAIVGAIIGIVSHALTGGRRDFASISGLSAERYEILVDEDVADRAAELLDVRKDELGRDTTHP